MSRTSRLTLAAFSAMLAVPATAQESSTLKDVGEAFKARSSGSITAIQTRPQAELSRNIDRGYGAAATYLFRLDDRGWLSIRGDLGVAQYGSESRETPFSDAIGDRVRVDLSTSNYIVPMSLGLQLGLPTGPVRPYLNAALGGVAFFTESTVSGTQANTIASTTNQSSMTSSWVAGGGLSIPFRAGRMPLAFEGGVQYVRGGTARYLAPGRITDLPNGRTAIATLESKSPMTLVHLGLRIGR